MARLLLVSLLLWKWIALCLAQKRKVRWFGRRDPSEPKDPWWTRIRLPWVPGERRRRRGPRARPPPFTPTIIENFLTEERAAALLERYRPLLRDSLHHNERTGGASKTAYRTSRSVRLPPLGDPDVADVERRAASAANLTHGAVEDFQLACYGPGELYGLHRDDNDSAGRGAAAAASAHRAATVLIYLQAPTAGGETLFTRRPLEDERELGNPQQPLRTEAAALELFRSYCERPETSFFIASPVVGRAVAWWSWQADPSETVPMGSNGTTAGSPSASLTRFVRDSTHGACPVAETSAVEKCVIQQWIMKSPEYYHPLRRDAVAAIFPIGADVSFQEKLRPNYRSLLEQDSSPCWTDVSTNQGEIVPTLCGAGPVALLDDGPYGGVGAVRVSSAGGGLRAEWTDRSLPPEGVTISFWVRNVPEGTVLVSLGSGNRTVASVTLSSRRDKVHTWQLQRRDQVAKTTFLADGDEWLWCSLLLLSSNNPSATPKPLGAELLFQSQRGEQLGIISLVESEDPTCLSDTNNETRLTLSLLEPVQPVRTTGELDGDPPDRTVRHQPVDISFLVVHRDALSLEERRSLRYQIKRYDINS
jgi:hypothetical protein